VGGTRGQGEWRTEIGIGKSGLRGGVTGGVDIVAQWSGNFVGSRL